MERPLTERIRPDGAPVDLTTYERAGGYQALRRTLGRTAPRDLTEMVTQANLRGRGGAGFPTGVKWSLVPMGENAPRPKYLVCNADEMEPGTFKDRLLLEGDPHLLIEGMILAGYAIGADVAYVFLRLEYRRAAAALSRAIADAYRAGYLGNDILKSGYRLEMVLHASAGRYICGEETALLNALEGRRPIPRSKPPFPQVSGLFGKPTVVQNVETLCNLPPLVARGVEWFRGLSRTEEGGTKIYGASGKVRRPGAWELPMGTPLGEIVEEHAGGMCDGVAFRGVLPGGASTDFLVEEHWNVPLDFAGPMKVGSRLGTGTLIVLDDHTCPVGFTHNLMRFFAQESCGWCTPCREGLPWLMRTLGAIEAGHGRAGDLELLEAHSRQLGMGSTFCALAPGAMEPLGSALKYFRDDFAAHLRLERCPFGAPRAPRPPRPTAPPVEACAPEPR
jgi:NADH-quinone oxidoreductase subunit F